MRVTSLPRDTKFPSAATAGRGGILGILRTLSDTGERFRVPSAINILRRALSSSRAAEFRARVNDKNRREKRRTEATGIGEGEGSGSHRREIKTMERFFRSRRDPLGLARASSTGWARKNGERRPPRAEAADSS